jgi:DNA-binding MarR family transcriptional regulator
MPTSCQYAYTALVELERDDDIDVAAVEAAMVAIRRRQNRKTLAQQPAGGRLSPRDVALMAVLDVVEEAQRAGQAATVGSVAAAIDVDQPRASKLVTGAIGVGLVRREADQSDGRRALLVLTAAGQEQLERTHRFRRHVFAEAMGDWSAAERHQFARLLTRFVAALV